MRQMFNMLATTSLQRDGHITTELLRLSREAEEAGFVSNVGACLTCRYITEIAITETMIVIIWLLFVLDVTQKYMMIELSQKEEETL